MLACALYSEPKIIPRQLDEIRALHAMVASNHESFFESVTGLQALRVRHATQDDPEAYSRHIGHMCFGKCSRNSKYADSLCHDKRGGRLRCEQSCRARLCARADWTGGSLSPLTPVVASQPGAQTHA